MFKHLNKHYYNKKTFRFGIIGVVLLVIFSGFVFGIIGGIVAVNMNKDFYSWVKDSLEGRVPKEIKVNEKIIKSMIEEEGATIKAVNSALNSTVNIIISKEINYYNQTGPFVLPFETYPDYFSSEPNGTKKAEIGGGSGFIISKDGLILTNKHVIADEDAEYTVILSDGRRFDGKIIASDPFIDLAVLKIDAKDLPVIRLGDSDKLVLGQTAIAIGYSLSEYQNTVTKGIISGIKRRVSAQGETIDEAIQTDAAINPGNSGGPLVDLKGEVVGINTAVNLQGQLIGFAIPINSAKRVIESVKEHGRIVRPWLGVRYIPLNEKISRENNLPVDYGALLVRGLSPTEFAVIPGSPANKAGLKENDIILKVNDTKIDEDNSLAKIVSNYDIEVEIVLQVLRQGESIEIKVLLEEYKQEKSE